MAANEREVERMVVRLVGDQRSYQQMLKEAEARSAAAAKAIEDQAKEVAAAQADLMEDQARTLRESAGLFKKNQKLTDEYYDTEDLEEYTDVLKDQNKVIQDQQKQVKENNKYWELAKEIFDGVGGVVMHAGLAFTWLISKIVTLPSLLLKITSGLSDLLLVQGVVNIALMGWKYVSGFLEKVFPPFKIITAILEEANYTINSIVSGLARLIEMLIPILKLLASIYLIVKGLGLVFGPLRGAILIAGVVLGVLYSLYKMLQLVTNILVGLIRVANLPFRILAETIKLAYNAITGIPRLLRALPGLVSTAFGYLMTAIKEAYKWTTWLLSKIVSLVKSTISVITSLVQTVASIPGRLLNTAKDALASMEAGLRRVGMWMSGVAGAITVPLTTAANTFKSLGKAIGELAEKEEIAVDVAGTLIVMSERTGISIEKLNKTISTSSAIYKKWNAEADKMGLILSKDQVKAAQDLAVAYTRLKETTKGFWSQIGAAVAPTIKAYVDVMIGAIQWAIKWVKANQELIKTLFKTASVIGAIGTALVTAGTALSTLGTFLGPIVALLAAGAAAWTLWDTKMGQSLKGGAISLWKAYGDTVRTVYETIISYGKRAFEFVSTIVGGVTDALVAADIGKALDIVWQGIKISWITVLQEINTITQENFSGIFSNLAAGEWEAAWDAIRLMLEETWLNIELKFKKVWWGIKDVFDEASLKIKDTISSLVMWITDKLADLMIKVGEILQKFPIAKVLTIKYLLQGSPIKAAMAAAAAEGRLFEQMGEGLITKAIDIKSQNERRRKGEIEPYAESVETAARERAGLAAKNLDRIRSSSKGRGYMTRQEALDESYWKSTLASAKKVIKANEEARQEAIALDDERKAAIKEINRRLDEQEKLEGQIKDIQEQRTMLAENGSREAAKALEDNEKALKVKLEEAKAARAAAEAAVPDNAETRKASADREKVLKEEKSRSEEMDKMAEELIKKHKPAIDRYAESLNTLKDLYEQEKIPLDVYRKAVKELNQELSEVTQKRFAIELEMHGLDVVRAGTKEFGQLMIDNLNRERLWEEMTKDQQKGRDKAVFEDMKSGNRRNEGKGLMAGIAGGFGGALGAAAGLFSGNKELAGLAETFGGLKMPNIPKDASERPAEELAQMDEATRNHAEWLRSIEEGAAKQRGEGTLRAGKALAKFGQGLWGTATRAFSRDAAGETGIAKAMESSAKEGIQPAIPYLDRIAKAVEEWLKRPTVNVEPAEVNS